MSSNTQKKESPNEQINSLNKKIKRLELFCLFYSLITIIIFVIIDINFNNLDSFIHSIFQQQYILTPNYYFNESNITSLNISFFNS